MLLPVKRYFSAVRMVNTVDAIEHCGFTGAVRADQRDQFRRRRLERNGPQGLDSAKAQLDFPNDKFGAGSLHPHHRRLRLYWRTLR